MPLITVSDLRIGFRWPAAAGQCFSCQIEPGQRIGLLGRNGRGQDHVHADSERRRSSRTAGKSLTRRAHTVAILPQDVPKVSPPRSGCRDARHSPPRDEHESDLGRRSSGAGHLLSSMDLPKEVPFESLSSGMKRRVLLGAGRWSSSPDLLLLDEPTNHLDVAAITWC